MAKGLAIQFEIEGEKHVERTLMVTSKKLTTYFRPLRKSADLLLRDIDQAFQTEGQIFEEAPGMAAGWEPLSPLYEAWKLKNYPGKGILERTGPMRRSFRDYVGTHELIIDNPIEYFRFHQSRRPGKAILPRRVMLFIRKVTKEKIHKFFQEYIQEATADWGRLK